MSDFINSIISHNGNILGDSIILSDDQSFTVEATAEKDGFYTITFNYDHGDWDQWIKVDIKGEKGESLEYMPSLIGKNHINDIVMHLYKGKNFITVTHMFGHHLRISDISVSKEKPLPISFITPSSDYFFLDKPIDCRILLFSYVGEPIKVLTGGKEIDFETKVCDFAELYSGDSLIRRYICIDKETLFKLGCGKHILKIVLPNNDEIEYELNIKQKEEIPKLKIVSLDVGHGNSSLICLPNGKNLMIDSGHVSTTEDVVYNYLQENNLKIDYYLLTHFHSDHDGMLNELLEKYSLTKPQEAIAQKNISVDIATRTEYLSRFSYLDSTMVCRYDELDKIWDLGGVKIKVLNSRFDENGKPLNIQNDPDIVYNEYNYENSTSVSLLLRYNGFGYYHGSDNYSYAQQQNLNDFIKMGEEQALKCQYFYANHHFHVDVNSEFIKSVNPVAVFVPANQVVYSRSAFTYVYQNEVVNADFKGKRLKDTFISHESGTVTVNVNSDEDWYYYTTKK